MFCLPGMQIYMDEFLHIVRTLYLMSSCLCFRHVIFHSSLTWKLSAVEVNLLLAFLSVNTVIIR